MEWDLAGPVAEVAPTLLGATLRLGAVAVRLTEVEAYGGAADPASHAFRGRTARNAVMFGPSGHLYVYLSYGMHWAVNVVCGLDGVASGTLLRSGEVVDGIEVARTRRYPQQPSTQEPSTQEPSTQRPSTRPRSDRDLARGPGRLTQALGITVEHRGSDVFGAGPVVLEPAPGPVGEIACGPRVGVSSEAERPWRFWLADDPYVSDYKRSPRAPVLEAVTR